MRLVYYDESGDDGYPKYSSPLFILTAIYMHYLSWKENYESVIEFRRQLKKDFGLPVKLEMHTKYFLLDKDPYREFKFSNDDRKQIITLFTKLIPTLNLKVINTVIVKGRIKSAGYNVLDTALKYSVQRIENDIDPQSNPNERFIIITDPGRISKMRETTRRIQKINYIPSKYESLTYRKEIISLIEDPLPKESEESYFIQIADLIAYLINLYTLIEFGIAELPNRMKDYLSYEEIKQWIELLKDAFNTKATTNNTYGIVYHPLK